MIRDNGFKVPSIVLVSGTQKTMKVVVIIIMMSKNILGEGESKIHCKHFWKCHNVLLVHMLIK
jgi:hypothetical protein